MGQAGCAGGQADRDGQDVVDHQAGPGEQAESSTQVLFRDRIRATASGVDCDHLAVGRHQDNQQHRDRYRDRQGEGGGARSSRHEGDNDGLRPVGDAGQRIQ
jgi:hypothetical protein